MKQKQGKVVNVEALKTAIREQKVLHEADVIEQKKRRPRKTISLGMNILFKYYLNNVSAQHQHFAVDARLEFNEVFGKEEGEYIQGKCDDNWNKRHNERMKSLDWDRHYHYHKTMATPKVVAHAKQNASHVRNSMGKIRKQVVEFQVEDDDDTTNKSATNSSNEKKKEGNTTKTPQKTNATTFPKPKEQPVNSGKVMEKAAIKQGQKKGEKEKQVERLVLDDAQDETEEGIEQEDDTRAAYSDDSPKAIPTQEIKLGNKRKRTSTAGKEPPKKKQKVN